MPTTTTNCLLQELSSQINQLIHRPEENLTSYFPNYHTLLGTFENYLKEVKGYGGLLGFSQDGNQDDEDLMGDSWRIVPKTVVFREMVGYDVLRDVGIVVGVMRKWGFIKGDGEIRRDDTYLKNPNQTVHILPNCSLVQIILLIYLQLQVQIFLKKADLIQPSSSQNPSPQTTFYHLKLVIRLLSQMQQSLTTTPSFSKKPPTSLSQTYWINSDKLIKLLLNKTVSMKLTKQTTKKPSQKDSIKQLSISVKDIVGRDFEGKRQNSEGVESNDVTFEGFQDQRQQSFEESFHLENYLQLAEVGVSRGRQTEVNQQVRQREYVEESKQYQQNVQGDREDEQNLTWMGLIYKN